MSLLMDALKRAEESKRLAEGKTEENALASNPQTLLPVDAPRGSSSLPDLSLHYDSVDADLAAVSAEASPLRRISATAAKPTDSGSRDAFERAAARNVFTAKKKSPNRPNGLWLFLGLSGIVVVGFCAYFWWQLQTASKGSLSQPAPALPTAQAVTPPAPTTTTPSPPGMGSPAPTAADAGKPISEASSAIALVLPLSPEPLPAAEPAPAPRKAAPVAASVGPESPVRLSRSQPKSNQTLEQAYEANGTYLGSHA